MGNQGGVLVQYETKIALGYFYFNPWKFQTKQTNKAQPLDIPQNCVRSLGNSKAKARAKTPGNSFYFSWSPLEIPLCF